MSVFKIEINRLNMRVLMYESFVSVEDAGGQTIRVFDDNLGIQRHVRNHKASSILLSLGAGRSYKYPVASSLPTSYDEYLVVEDKLPLFIRLSRVSLSRIAPRDGSYVQE